MKKPFQQILVLILTFVITIAGFPSVALASGDAGLIGYNEPVIPEIHQNGGVISKPVTPIHVDITGPKKDMGSFPASFLLPDTRLTSVKNQNPYGDCWAFAAMASSESVLETNGLAADPDLSERQLAYYAYVSQSGLPAFTKKYSGSVYDEGGNDTMATALLARGTSPVWESEAPFTVETEPAESTVASYALKNMYSAYKDDLTQDYTEWKSTLMDHGALYASFYYDDAYFNSSTNSYYNNVTSDDTNHAVTIVGWDDNYSITNFSADPAYQPAGNGAWIIKNSWGETWGSNGYFYLSYYDTSLNDFTEAFELKPAAAGEKAYTYADLGWIGNIELLSNEIIYTKTNYTCARTETLTSIGIFAATNNTTYGINIAVMDPSTGNYNYVWNALQTGEVAMSGFSRIDLANPVPLIAGQQYAVIIAYANPITGTYIPIEMTVSNFSTNSRYAAGQSYISGNGTEWVDLYSYYTVPCDLCTYAYTVPRVANYTVAFNSQGGSDVAQATVAAGALVPEPAAPAMAGYSFTGWYRDAACTAKWNFSADTMPEGNLTLYAGWALNQYIVTYDSQGGSAVAPAGAGHGSIIAEPQAPARGGWYFSGWYREPSCVNRWNFSTDTVTSSITLYARWATQTQAATLSGIALSAGSLSPAFSPSKKSYTVYLDENTGSVTITPVKTYAGATLTINGKKAAGKTVSVACGKSASLTVKVAFGKKNMTVKLTVKRAKSSNNLLYSLRASAGTLSPAFDPNVTAYTLTLPAGTAKVKLTAAKASKLSNITNGSKTYTLKKGQTVKGTVKVKAQSGKTRTYTIFITRAIQ